MAQESWQSAPLAEDDASTPASALDLVKKFEGNRLNAYNDVGGTPTIGYGHTTGVRPGQAVSQQQADDYLQQDLSSASSLVRQHIKAPLTPEQEAAATSAAFNLGPQLFVNKDGRPTGFAQAINSGDHSRAADELMRFNHANGQVIPGLTKRRAVEAAAFRAPEEDWQKAPVVEDDDWQKAPLADATPTTPGWGEAIAHGAERGLESVGKTVGAITDPNYDAKHLNLAPENALDAPLDLEKDDLETFAKKGLSQLASGWPTMAVAAPTGGAPLLAEMGAFGTGALMQSHGENVEQDPEHALARDALTFGTSAALAPLMRIPFSGGRLGQFAGQLGAQTLGIGAGDIATNAAMGQPLSWEDIKKRAPSYVVGAVFPAAMSGIFHSPGRALELPPHGGPTPVADHLQARIERELGQKPAEPQPAPAVSATPTAHATVETPADLEAAAARIQPNVTLAQAEAGNYSKAHIDLMPEGPDGPKFKIALENGSGEFRSGTDPDGQPWSSKMPADYGYFKGTKGADGEPLDVYVGPDVKSDQAFVVNTKDPATGKFDEHKVMVGFPDAATAQHVFEAAYSDGSGPNRVESVVPLSIQDLKAVVDLAKKHPLDKPLTQPPDITNKYFTETPLSREEAVQHAQLMKAVQGIVRRMAPAGTDVKGVKSIVTKDHPDHETGHEVNAYAHPTKNLIALALGADNTDVIGTTRHEVLHSVWNLMTDPEKHRLMRAAVDEDWLTKHDVHERWKKADDVQKIEEAVAEEFAAWRRKPDGKLPGPVASIFRRMQNQLQRIAAATRQILGKDMTVNDIFSRIERGEMAKRAIPEPRTARPSTQAAANKLREAALPEKDKYGFYSKAEHEVAKAPMEKADGKQWLGYLTGKGVKQEEFVWSGLADILKDRPNEIFTRGQILDFLAKNTPRVEVKESQPARHEKWSMPGGDNYRELLFTFGGDNPVAKLKLGDERHYPGVNGLFAHARVKDRIDTHGNKILHIDELQSQFHQEGRDFGYNTPAPFAKTWHELALRNMIRYAAENGYDAVAWTPGETIAKRFNIAADVDHIDYQKVGDKWDVVARDIGGGEVSSGRVDAKRLQQDFGKSIFERIKKGENADNIGRGRLTDLDFNTGKGMEGFYDKIVPNYVNSFVKKFGSKVEKHFTVEPTNQTLEGAFITKAMREALPEEGVPIFQAQRRRQGAAPAPPPGGTPPTTPPGPHVPPPPHAFLRSLQFVLGPKSADAFNDILRDLQMKIAPMAVRAKGALLHEVTELFRAAAKDYHGGMRLADWGVFTDLEKFNVKYKKDPTAQVRMHDALARESEAHAAGQPPPRDGLMSLTADERADTLEIVRKNEQVWNAARAAGLVHGDFIPYYATRKFAEMTATGSEAHHGDGLGAELDQKVGPAGKPKRRTQDTEAASEAAAQHVTGKNLKIVRDIRTNILARGELERSIAIHKTVEALRQLGDRAGLTLVANGKDPFEGGGFTINHPAFMTNTVRMAMGPDGPAAIFDSVPIIIHKDFEGPLRTMLRQRSGPLAKALMDLKARGMSVIMYSPVIHNAVVWGKALPSLPGKTMTGIVYRDGHRFLQMDEPGVREAIFNGLAPIGRNAQFQDIDSILAQRQLAPGQSFTAKALAAIPGMFDARAGEAVKRGVDKMGDFWHNTLLWDRVRDLQFGLYMNFRDQMIAKGYDRTMASRYAATFANQMAGSMPVESMSQNARTLANMVLFSRSFTLGNLSVFKSAITGLPRDIQAQNIRDFGAYHANKLNTAARNKARFILGVDMAMYYVGNSLLQSMINTMGTAGTTGTVAGGATGAVLGGVLGGPWGGALGLIGGAIAGAQGTQPWWNGDTTFKQEVAAYVARMNHELKRYDDNPWAIFDLPGDIGALTRLSSTSANEPGREDKVMIGHEADGTAIYARNPTGKFGEEVMLWPTAPFDMIKKKLSPMIKPGLELLLNSDGFGNPILNPHPETTADYLKNIGKGLVYYGGSQVPSDSIKALGQATGINQAVGITNAPAKDVDVYKTLGPMVGLTFSKGAPGGPLAGFRFSEQAKLKLKQTEAMPYAKDLIRGGQIGQASAMLRNAGVKPGVITYIIKTTLNPRMYQNPRAMMQLRQQLRNDPDAEFQLQQLNR